MKISRLYEIETTLENDGHFKEAEDLKEIRTLLCERSLIQEVLKEKRIASNAKVSRINYILNGVDDELPRFLG